MGDYADEYGKPGKVWKACLEQNGKAKARASAEGPGAEDAAVCRELLLHFWSSREGPKRARGTEVSSC